MINPINRGFGPSPVGPVEIIAINSTTSPDQFHSPAVTTDLTTRPRLLAQITAGLDSRLVLVSAPAGFGKSVLLAQWAASPQGRAFPLTWLSLDADDDDPIRFWGLVISALRDLPLTRKQAFSAGSWIFDDSLALVQSEQPPPWQFILAALLTEIAAIPERFILAIDNYQAIQNETIHQGLISLVEHLPARARIILATRKDLPFPLARWRTRKYLAEIRLADLRFTAEETRQAHDLFAFPPLPDEIVSLLGSRAEGWITGFRLSTLAFQGMDPVETKRLIAAMEGKGGAVLERLVEAVLQRQTAPVRTFLLQTSILGHFTADLAGAVLVDEAMDVITPGETLSLNLPESILDYLDRKSMFLEAASADRTWYRYQPLFAELLEARLQAIRPGLASWLHRRTAAWFEAKGMLHAALSHARQARDYELTADIMERALKNSSIWIHRETAIFLEWLKQLNEAQLSARPWLRLFIYRSRTPVEQMFTGDKYLTQMEQALVQMPDSSTEAGRLLGLVFESRASLAVIRSDPHLAVTYANKAIENLPQDYALAICRAYLTLGSARSMLGDMINASQAFSQAASIAISTGLRQLAFEAGADLAELQLDQGQLSQALQTCQRTAPLGTYTGRPAPAIGWLRLIEAETAFHRNDLAAAERLAKEGLDLLERGQVTARAPLGYALLAYIRQTAGDIEGANTAIQTALDLAEASQEHRLISLAAAYQARIWLAQHDYLRAFPWAEKYRTEARSDYRRDFEDLTLARSLLANDQAEEVLSRLDSLLALARRASAMGRVIEILALRALTLQILGSQPKALDNLGQSLFLAEQEGYLRVFLNEGLAMQLMILALREQLTTQASGMEGDRVIRLLAFIDQILAAFPPLQPGPTSLGVQSGQTLQERRQDTSLPVGQTSPLNAREEAVLGLLSQGMSNREIAQKLFLSANTLRAYTVSLFNKLGVDSRADAIIRARQFGLIPPSAEDQK